MSSITFKACPEVAGLLERAVANLNDASDGLAQAIVLAAKLGATPSEIGDALGILTTDQVGFILGDPQS